MRGSKVRLLLYFFDSGTEVEKRRAASVKKSFPVLVLAASLGAFSLTGKVAHRF